MMPDRNITSLSMFKMSKLTFDHGRLGSVPNEILLNIMSGMPDIQTLHDFLVAYPPSKDLYPLKHIKTLSSTVQQGESMQIQKLICTVMNLCNRPKLPFSTKDLYEMLSNMLEDKTTSLILTKMSDPLRALRDITQINKDIESFIGSSVAERLRKTGTSSCPKHPEKSPSRTEIHRIRRAL